MFCKNCGSEMADDAMFCNNCGTPVNGTVNATEKIDDNEVLISLKPKFKWGYEIISALLQSLLWAAIIDLWVVEDGYMLFMFKFIWGIVALVFLIRLFFLKAQYKNTEYKFFATRVEYVDGFLNKEQKEVKYRNIKEVTKTENILERMFKLGKVKLTTNVSMGRNQRTNRNGITVHCIENVTEVAKQINELVDRIEDEE